MKIAKMIMIFGMRRSGNHAIHNWLKPCFKSCFYINDSYFGLLLGRASHLVSGQKQEGDLLFSGGKAKLDEKEIDGFDGSLIGVENWSMSDLERDSKGSTSPRKRSKSSSIMSRTP